MKCGFQERNRIKLLFGMHFKETMRTPSKRSSYIEGNHSVPLLSLMRSSSPSLLSMSSTPLKANPSIPQISRLSHCFRWFTHWGPSYDARCVSVRNCSRTALGSIRGRSLRAGSINCKERPTFCLEVRNCQGRSFRGAGSRSVNCWGCTPIDAMYGRLSWLQESPTT